MDNLSQAVAPTRAFCIDYHSAQSRARTLMSAQLCITFPMLLVYYIQLRVRCERACILLILT